MFSFSSATSFSEIVLSAEQPTCHSAPRANPLILPRVIARLLVSQPVKITGGERNCSMIPIFMCEEISVSSGPVFRQFW